MVFFSNYFIVDLKSIRVRVFNPRFVFPGPLAQRNFLGHLNRIVALFAINGYPQMNGVKTTFIFLISIINEVRLP